MIEVVLDASALLAYLEGEPGAEVVNQYIAGGVITSLNLAEVVTKIVQRGATHADMRTIIGALRCDMAPVDTELGVSAGILHAATRAFGLSLGDCVCLALAMRDRLPVLTADRAWAALDLPITVTLIR